MPEVSLPCLDEQTIDRMVRGALPPELRASVEKHLADCAACIELVGMAASNSGAAETPPEQGEPPALDQVLAVGAAFGRYTVLSLTGRGGTAEVYAAYDPELDRKVALKLLGREEGRTAFDDIPFTAVPFYTGNAWFRPLMTWAFRARDMWRGD